MSTRQIPMIQIPDHLHRDRKDVIPDEDEQEENRIEVDKDLVAMFLKLTPEERIRANDNAVRAILELRNAFKKRKIT
ncbi:hypothetical protein QUF76_07400 [Desulfobacterales bacterium HSG16]|nr:hypothetical protein [Desulfobacterales bacterium HSG16]